jgi:glycolate oxidase FAD binding subunit
MDMAIDTIAERVRGASAPFAIRGTGSKEFYGEPVRGEPLSTLELKGITSYEPTELVVTVRAGTAIADLEAALAERGQQLAFEPPRFGGRGSVGGMVAAGLAGPARAAAGSVRDHLLGATLVDGRGDVVRFGGRVMKNVAGYDVSRALAGSLGILGVICEVSLKVVPLPAAIGTLEFHVDEAEALRRLDRWAGQPLPVSASAWRDGRLYLRLAGAAAAVEAAARGLGGDALDPGIAAQLWRGLRDHDGTFHHRALDAVEQGRTWWRISLPAATAPLALDGDLLIEQGGTLRWLVTDHDAATVRAAASRAGGHATQFRALDRSPGVFAPLSAPLARLHRALKHAFDPRSLFNPGRLYPGL